MRKLSSWVVLDQNCDNSTPLSRFSIPLLLKPLLPDRQLPCAASATHQSRIFTPEKARKLCPCHQVIPLILGKQRLTLLRLRFLEASWQLWQTECRRGVDFDRLGKGSHKSISDPQQILPLAKVALEPHALGDPKRRDDASLDFLAGFR
jgi:hypothetical protein